MQEDPNYGRFREAGDEFQNETREAPGEGPGVGFGGPDTDMSPHDERTWSILSHLSVLAWPITGFLPVAPLIVWLFYKDRSPRVGFHALQSLWYQVAWLVILVIGWFVTFILMLVLVGFLLVPVMALASVVPFVHSGYAAYKVSQGIDYRYPFVADRIDGGRRMV